MLIDYKGLKGSWSHYGISLTDSEVRTTLHNIVFIIDSGRERVKLHFLLDHYMIIVAVLLGCFEGVIGVLLDKEETW